MVAKSFPVNNSLVGASMFVLTSISTDVSADAVTALQSGFRGIYIQSTCTLVIKGIDGVTASVTNPAIGQILWMAGMYLMFTGSVASTPIGVR